MKDPLGFMALAGFWSMFHFAAHKWMEKTEIGRNFKTFLQTWRTDSLLHLILCGFTVVTYGICALLSLGLLFKYLGI